MDKHLHDFNGEYHDIILKTLKNNQALKFIWKAVRKRIRGKERVAEDGSKKVAQKGLT